MTYDEIAAQLVERGDPELANRVKLAGLAASIREAGHDDLAEALLTTGEVLAAKRAFSDGVAEVIYVDSAQKMLKVIQEMGFDGEADFKKETGLSISSKDLHGWWAIESDESTEPDPKDLEPHLEGKGFSFTGNRVYPLKMQIYQHNDKFYADAGDFL